MSLRQLDNLSNGQFADDVSSNDAEANIEADTDAINSNPPNLILWGMFLSHLSQPTPCILTKSIFIANLILPDPTNLQSMFPPS